MLRDGALAAVAAAPDTAALAALDVEVLGKKGTLTGGPARDRRPAARRSAPGRRGRQRGPDIDRGRPCRAWRDAAGRRAGRPPRHGGGRRDHPGPADRPGRPPSDHRDDGPDRRDLRPVRLHRPRGARGRGRPDQLPDAQHRARPSGPRPVGHPLRGRARPSPADPHVAPPDPGDAGPRAADPGAPARPRLPLRGGRCESCLRVLPGRGPDGRRGHDDGRPARPARRVLPGHVRPGQADPLPTGLLPVHRAVGGVRRRVPGVRRVGLPGLLADRLDDDPGRGHGPPGRPPARRARSRSATRASPSGWASSGSPTCATGSGTCACTSRTTCASWSSSDESPAQLAARLHRHPAHPRAAGRAADPAGHGGQGDRGLGRRLALGGRRRAADRGQASPRGSTVADDGRRRRRPGPRDRVRRDEHRARPARPGRPARRGPARRPADRAGREDGRRLERDALLGRRAQPHERRGRDPDPAARDAAGHRAEQPLRRHGPRHRRQAESGRRPVAGGTRPRGRRS